MRVRAYACVCARGSRGAVCLCAGGGGREGGGWRRYRRPPILFGHFAPDRPGVAIEFGDIDAPWRLNPPNQGRLGPWVARPLAVSSHQSDAVAYPLLRASARSLDIGESPRPEIPGYITLSALRASQFPSGWGIRTLRRRVRSKFATRLPKSGVLLIRRTRRMPRTCNGDGLSI